VSTSTCYPLGLAALLTGDVDVVADTIKAVLVDDGYVYSSAHDFLDDVSAYVLATVTLGTKSVDGGSSSPVTPCSHRCPPGTPSPV